MNVAMLGHKRIPSREGGVEVVVEELSKRMVRRGHHVCCFNRGGAKRKAPGQKKGTAPDENSGGAPVLKTVWTLNRRGLSAVTSAFSGTIAAAAGAYDIIHIHTEGSALFCWIPKLFHRTVVVTVHGLDYQREKWGPVASRVILQGEKNAVRYADEIIVLSRAAQRYFRDTYGRRTVYIPNGAEHGEIRPAARIAEKWGLGERSYVLFLGRLVPEKGLRYLLESWKDVKTEKTLVIAGGASDTAAFERELKQRAAGERGILFTGHVEGEILRELYSNAYLYVLPSNLEGMPLSLLEAMSFGNCCLVSDIPECTEVVEDRAVTFRRGSTEDLREKLQFLCDHPEEAARFRDQAESYICGRYSWEDTVDQTLDLYRTILKRKGAF